MLFDEELESRLNRTFDAFADETHYNIGRYRGVGVITLPSSQTIAVRKEVRDILVRSSVREFKWSHLRSARERHAAVEIVNYMIAKAAERSLRIDVMTWDINDSRHRIRGRSDLQNLKRMYYFLFRDVLFKRWPSDTIWNIFVDESTNKPWGHLHYLDQGTDWKASELLGELTLREVVDVDSADEPLVQVADLFAGLAVYSRRAYQKYEKWSSVTTNQEDSVKRRRDFSRTDQERCPLIAQVNQLCKKYKLGVSLRSRKGFYTYNPANPVNFWWYEPQSEQDKAPH